MPLDTHPSLHARRPIGPQRNSRTLQKAGALLIVRFPTNSRPSDLFLFPTFDLLLWELRHHFQLRGRRGRNRGKKADREPGQLEDRTG